MGNINSIANIKKAISKKRNNSPTFDITESPNPPTETPAAPTVLEPNTPNTNTDIAKEISGLEIRKMSAPNKTEVVMKQKFRKGTIAERRSVGSASPRRPILNLAPVKSNPDDLQRISDSRKNILPRTFTGLKPPRLDTSKIALLASKNSPDFSPLSANASDRAKAFLDLALLLYNGNYLHIIYHGWILGQGVTSIRNSCKALFEKIKQLEQARLDTDGNDLSRNSENISRLVQTENSMDAKLVDPSETEIKTIEIAKKPSLEDKFKYSRKQAYTAKNSSLNRYADIAPFDRNRVILSTKPKDYINASFMKSLDGQREYIATQGPLPTTLGDFWQMTWEQNSAVIVMLTQIEESTRIKSHKYWPDNVGDTKRYHKSVGNNSICFKVYYADEIQMMDGTTVIRELIVTREMLLKDNDEEPMVEIRLIRIIHYLSWSDYDSCDARSLLSLIDIVNEVNRQASRDVIVHRDSNNPFKIGPMIINCSAGVGRTGTFCTADSVLSMLTNPLPILSEVDQSDWDQLPPEDIIARTVNHFRTQRCGFVQTAAQFELLYDAVLLKLGDLFTAKVEPKWTCVQKIS